MYKELSINRHKISPDSFQEFIRILDFEITGFGSGNQNTVQKLDKFIISSYKLVFVTKGATEIAIGRNKSQCNSGKVAFFEPFVPITTSYTGEESVEYYYINFDIKPYYLADLLRSIVFKNDYCVEVASDFKDEIKSILQYNTEETEGVYTLLYSFMLKLFSSIIIGKDNKKLAQLKEMNFYRRERLIIDKAIEIVDSSLNQPVKIAEISQEIGISQNYLYKTFMKVTNVSPVKFFLRYKIKKAEQMLNLNVMTIQEIAEALGFNSMFHFSKTFKDILGVSPTYYKKKYF